MRSPTGTRCDEEILKANTKKKASSQGGWGRCEPPAPFTRSATGCPFFLSYGAKLPSDGLSLNASKSESVLESNDNYLQRPLGEQE